MALYCVTISNRAQECCQTERLRNLQLLLITVLVKYLGNNAEYSRTKSIADTDR